MTRKNEWKFLVVLAMATLPIVVMGQTMGFTRAHEIPVPDIGLNVGGLGNIVAGYDLDGDSRPDLYAVNHNWGDEGSEMIPRIYKFEYTGTAWEIVWQCSIATATIEKTNTWPALTIGDLDGDSKDELIFGPVNWATTEMPNPPRVAVFEEAGDGTDVMGILEGSANYAPNSTWTITTQDNVNLRPFRWVVEDVDNDDTDELVFADRKGNDSGYYFGVASVDDIPDAGGGSETWTLETSGLDFTLSSNPENKWDVAVIDSNIYTFSETEISKLSWSGGAWTYDSLPPMEGGASFNAAQVVDLDNDGTKEIVITVHDWGDDAKKAVMLLQEDGDTLVHTELASVSTYFPGNGPMGGASGDIDGDGKLDYVFGSRAADPNAAIFRLAYKGGAIDAPASYELSIIDSNYADGGRWGVIAMADYDGDSKDEVFYMSTIPAGGLTDTGPKPIVVLDYTDVTATEPTAGVPVAFDLHQNYPNPFNPSTTISFVLPQAAELKLVVYDLLGRDVVTLAQGHIEAGSHEVVWNGKSSMGREMPAGIYLARLSSSAYSRSIKMVYLK